LIKKRILIGGESNFTQGDRFVDAAREVGNSILKVMMGNLHDIFI